MSTDIHQGPEGTPRAIRAGVPCRACLSGEDLDWLGGRSVSLALDLVTTVETVPGPPPARDGGWSGEVWEFLRGRLAGLPADPPAVRVRSDAPGASGLSSSTALIVALFRAYTEACAPDPGIPAPILAEWAYAFEFARFNGGGMDHLAVIEGGALLLDGRTEGLPAIRERAAFPGEWSVLVVDSATRKDTSDHIKVVRAQLAAGDPDLAAYRKEADAASGEVWAAIGARDLDALAAAMDRAHVTMRDHQRMSTPVLEELRELALRSAGLRLKLSGAGGGGALVGVCRTDDRDDVVAAVRRALADPYPAARVIPTRAAPDPAF
ncbi:GHMP family kinase ATP-binding protein [Streptomyces yaizuensis]|uniref:Galactokinase n=1 Tax=Streptomyces yaizuensis TaxID=2989713 RepID=A0ABQ5NQV2_9ACTN|nr:galactokinase [Streptomyces sp. YSPA8]GLF92695.1 galactokinase [Streptomyces sp. YSPA8]